MRKTKIFLSNPQIKYFIVNHLDKIIETGDPNTSDWDSTYVDLDRSKMNKEVYVSFNKKHNEKIGKKPTYVTLNNCIITKIESL